RTLFAKMLMNEWNAEIKYTPLSELVNEKPQENKATDSPEEAQQKVDQVLNKDVSELKKESWFRRLVNEPYDLWVDLADQEKKDRMNAQNKSSIDSLMIVALNSENGSRAKTLQRPNSIFSVA